MHNCSCFLVCVMLSLSAATDPDCSDVPGCPRPGSRAASEQSRVKGFQWFCCSWTAISHHAVQIGLTHKSRARVRACIHACPWSIRLHQWLSKSQTVPVFYILLQSYINASMQWAPPYSFHYIAHSLHSLERCCCWLLLGKKKSTDRYICV